MTFDPDSVETILFDSYSTIVDVTQVVEPLSAYVDHPEYVSKLWRNRSLGYVMVANHIGEYHPFYELIGAALDYALDVAGADVSDEEREELLATYHELDAFDDVVDGMKRLRDAGYDLYVLSNGNPEMLESMVEHAGIGDLLEDAISAEAVERFKPAEEPYRHAADTVDAVTENIAFVSAGWWDVPGAVNVGMQGVWINRQQTLWGPFDAQPDLTIATFHELADELDA